MTVGMNPLRSYGWSVFAHWILIFWIFPFANPSGISRKFHDTLSCIVILRFTYTLPIQLRSFKGKNFLQIVKGEGIIGVTMDFTISVGNMKERDSDVTLRLSGNGCKTQTL